MPDIDIRIQWHTPDSAFAAVFIRDGQEWYLDGALVGMDRTPGSAVDDLMGIAHHLVLAGENFLTEGPISQVDRQWLFDLMDRGNDTEAIQARYDAMREAYG